NLLGVDNELTVLRDQVTEASYARLNEHMRRQAGSHLDASISLIVQKLTPILEKFVEDQEEAYRQAAEDVEKYLSDHRNEDIFQAEVTEARLAADNRVAQIVQETNERIEALHRETEETIAAKTEQMTRQEKEFRAELSRRDEIVQAVEE